MIPLNLYLNGADDAQVAEAIREYGDAIRDLAAANIFPGDMLYKNFGVTRQGRVVFYDYDELCYLTECKFRAIPEAPYPEMEMSDETWYSVGPDDVFPEEFATFLLTRPAHPPRLPRPSRRSARPGLVARAAGQHPRRIPGRCLSLPSGTALSAEVSWGLGAVHPSPGRQDQKRRRCLRLVLESLARNQGRTPRSATAWQRRASGDWGGRARCRMEATLPG